MTDYEEVGLTAEKYAEIAADLIEILVKQINVNDAICEINKRHPELTDEQKAVLQLDKQYTDEEIDHYVEEAFGDSGGLKSYIQQALTGTLGEEVPDDDEEED